MNTGIHPPLGNAHRLSLANVMQCKGLPCSTWQFYPFAFSQLCKQRQVAYNCPNARFTTILQLIAA